jgi:hypothetical protein
MVSDTRGQVFTLEAFVAALLVLSSVAFALSVTAATPLSGSTSSQDVERHHASVGGSLLGTAQATDVLRPTLLAWNDSAGAFHGAADKGYHTACGFETDFGRLLETSLEDRGIACTVRVGYLTPTDDVRFHRLVYLGEPSDHAVRVRTAVTLYDDDVLLDASGSATSITLADAQSFYVPDAVPDDRLYNVVQVEVVLWRM